jgi:hypothetical protein
MMTGMARTVRPDPSWIDMLNAVRTFMAEHDGRWPTRTSSDPDEVALARWWLSQRLLGNAEKLSANRRAALTATAILSRDLQAEASQRRARSAKLAASNRRASKAAARRQARQAEQCIDSPHLLPSDREVLQLRIDHPQASMRELAELAGTTMTAFAGKLRGALRRGRR